MPLERGTRLGPFEIAAPLGAGGMGEVYLARDTRLKRDVALKVLPASFTQDPDRIARFQREAELLATLNHPNIAGIYGLEESIPSTGSGQTPPTGSAQAAVTAIVLELVEGETLSDRIARGALALDEALPIARQIIDALEAAHEKGVIHRDLKPANIKITPDGKVKVLDFGLAKMLEAEASSSSLSMSPTLTVHGTYAGMILGTAAYMSPEQARGKRVDRRTDVWAFGCVLFEMLSGKSVFAGEEVSDTLAFVITREPDWNALPPNTRAPIHKLLRRCLEKDRNRRLADIADARFELDEALTTTAEPLTDSLAPMSTRRVKVWAAATVALAITTLALGAIVAYLIRSIESPRVARFFVSPPDKTAFDLVTPGFNGGAISPDGRRMLFTARDAAGKVQLWMRPVDSVVSQPLAGTEGTSVAFWSPDSRFIGFFADGKLKKVDAAGGPPLTLANAPQNRGGSWGRDGVIVFAPSNAGPLSRVSATGGDPTAVTRMKPGDRSHRAPWFLPDGRHFLFVVQGASPGIHVGSLDSEETKRLQGSDTQAVYSPPGFLLFARQGTLLAQSFDLRDLQLTGEPFPIAERVATDPSNLFGAFSASDNGVLTYRTGETASENMQLAWFDRQGKQLETVGAPAPYRGIDLSPDGTRLAVHRHEGQGGDIWLLDLTRGTTSRFTFDASQENASPSWSPDGSRIAFGSLRGGSAGLYQKTSDGAANDDPLIQNSNLMMPMSWAPDGKSIVYWVNDPKTAGDLLVLPLTGDRKPFPFAQTTFAESHGQISPDGRWIAYHTNETGQSEVYVRPYPSGAGKWQISTNGGTWPRWRRDGKELFYMGNDTRRILFAVDVMAEGSALKAGVPKALFETRYVNLAHATGGNYHTFAVSPDGRRFLILRPATPSSNEAPPSPITVVLNWTAAIRR